MLLIAKAFWCILLGILELAFVIVAMSLGSSGGREALSLSEAEGQLGASASSLFESLPFFRSGRFASKSVASIERILSDWVLSKSRLLVLLFAKAFRSITRFSKTILFSSRELRVLKVSNDSSYEACLSCFSVCWLIGGGEADIGWLWEIWESSELELLSESEVCESQVLHSIAYLLLKEFRNVMLANWQARHGAPVVFHESCWVQPRHFVGHMILSVAFRKEHVMQKVRNEETLIGWLDRHLQKYVACLHICLV